MGEPMGLEEVRIMEQLSGSNANFHKSHHGYWDRDSMSNG